MSSTLAILAQDIRFAVRLLCRTPALTLAAFLALALSIGANTAIFSIVDAVLLRPLPYTEPDRLVSIWNSWVEKGYPQMPVVPSDYLEWKRSARLVEQLAATRPVSVNLTGGGDPERIRGSQASATLFPVLGASPLLGRTFDPREERPGADQVVILGEGLWTRRFGGDRGIVGRAIEIDGRPRTVIGVMPRRFGFSLSWDQAGLSTPPVDLWMPLALRDEELNNGFELTVVGRLRRGATIQQARDEIASIGRQITLREPDHRGIGSHVIGLHDVLTHDVRPAVGALAVAVGLVLVIACANVANLLLTAASARTREMAVRAALGASRGRLSRQLVTESLVLAAAAGTAGVLLAHGLTALLSRYAPDAVLRTGGIALDFRVLGFAVACSLGAALVFSIAPLWHVRAASLETSLRGSGRDGAEGRRASQVRNVLVVGEMALSVLLAVGGGLLLRSFLRVTAVDPGFRVEGVAMARVALPPSRYPDAPRILGFYDRVLEGVQAASPAPVVGLVSDPPLAQAREVFFTIEGKPIAGVKQAPVAVSLAVSPGYFQAAGIRLLRGRLLQDTDAGAAEKVAVIDETLARTYWPGEEPIGRRLREGYGNSTRPWIRVVGVTASVHQYGQAARPKPGMYLSFRQFPRRDMTVLVRSSATAAHVASSLRAVVRQVDPNQPIEALQTLADAFSDAVAPRRFSASLLAGFAAVALLLAAVGIYAVLSYTVSRRTREIGIRKALGAGPRQVVGMVMAKGLLLAGVGIAIGCVAASWFARFLSSQLFETAPTDLLTFALAPALLLLIAALACYVPARRANRVDPIGALREG